MHPVHRTVESNLLLWTLLLVHQPGASYAVEANWCGLSHLFWWLSLGFATSRASSESDLLFWKPLRVHQLVASLKYMTALAGLSHLFWWWLGSDASFASVSQEQTFVLEALDNAWAESVVMLWKQFPLVDCQICSSGSWVLLQLVGPFVLEALVGTSVGSIIKICESSRWIVAFVLASVGL
jgi:hypothetical protein